MNHLVNSLQDQAHYTYQFAEQAVHSLKKGIDLYLDTAKNQMNQSCRFAHQNCEYTAIKTKELINRHRETIFFIGCSTFTAYLAPQIFIPVALATMIIQIELSHYAKNSFPEYFRIYKMQAQSRSSYITSIDVIVAAIAAIAMVPLLGGITAGNCGAKWALDF